jgi:hypothetical protein
MSEVSRNDCGNWHDTLFFIGGEARQFYRGMIESETTAERDAGQ